MKTITKTRRVVVFAVVVIFAFAMAITVSANTRRKLCEPYGYIEGSSFQVSSGLSTNTAVQRNPDSAVLRVTVQLSDGLSLGPTFSHSSQRGAVSFSRTIPLPITPEGSPYIKAYCMHEVYLSTSKAFSVQTIAPLQ